MFLPKWSIKDVMLHLFITLLDEWSLLCQLNWISNIKLSFRRQVGIFYVKRLFVASGWSVITVYKCLFCSFFVVILESFVVFSEKNRKKGIRFKLINLFNAQTRLIDTQLYHKQDHIKNEKILLKDISLNNKFKNQMIQKK